MFKSYYSSYGGPSIGGFGCKAYNEIYIRGHGLCKRV